MVASENAGKWQVKRLQNSWRFKLIQRGGRVPKSWFLRWRDLLFPGSFVVKSTKAGLLYIELKKKIFYPRILGKYPLLSKINLVPRAPFPFGQHQGRGSRNRSRIGGRVELGADQNESGLWGRDCVKICTQKELFHSHICSNKYSVRHNNKVV